MYEWRVFRPEPNVPVEISAGSRRRAKWDLQRRRRYHYAVWVGHATPSAPGLDAVPPHAAKVFTLCQPSQRHTQVQGKWKDIETPKTADAPADVRMRERGGEPLSICIEHVRYVDSLSVLILQPSDFYEYHRQAVIFIESNRLCDCVYGDRAVERRLSVS